MYENPRNVKNIVIGHVLDKNSIMLSNQYYAVYRLFYFLINISMYVRMKVCAYLSKNGSL